MEIQFSQRALSPLDGVDRRSSPPVQIPIPDGSAPSLNSPTNLDAQPRVSGSIVVGPHSSGNGHFNYGDSGN